MLMMHQWTTSLLWSDHPTTRRAVEDTLGGQYHSVFKGRGMDFSEVRAYAPGHAVVTSAAVPGWAATVDGVATPWLASPEGPPTVESA